MRLERLRPGPGPGPGPGPDSKSAALEPSFAPAKHATRIELPPLLTQTTAALLTQRLKATLPLRTEAERTTLAALLDATPSHARETLLKSISANVHKRGLIEHATTFAARLAAMSEQDRPQLTSVIDRDWKHNDNLRDPLALSDHRGVIHARGGNDRATDNDGLFQRFTASCGPSVIQTMLAEYDPAYALKLHDAGLYGEGTHDLVAQFQRELLEAHGGIAVGEQAVQMRARFRNALGRLPLDRRPGVGDAPAALATGRLRIAHDDVAALRAYVEDKKKLTAGAARALHAMRAEFEGFPSSAELQALRRRKLPPRDEGLGFEDFAAALAKVITPVTGIEYQQTTPADGFARGQAWRHLDAVARALRRGVLVPFGLCEPSHWMLLSKVEGRKGSRRFLVSDPLGGKTAWVSERDLISGAFARDQFHLCVGHERGYIDSFFLPRR